MESGQSKICYRIQRASPSWSRGRAMASSIEGLGQRGSFGRQVTMGISHFCVCFARRCFEGICPTLSFKVVFSTYLRTKHQVCLLSIIIKVISRHRQSRHIACFKRYVFPKLKVLHQWYKPTVCTTFIWGLGVKGTNTSMELAVLQVIKWFVSDPGILSLVSIHKLWHINLWAVM